ncbi:MAG: hypothetical protein Q4F07_08395 [Bacteroidales bacterium]|nr:hypothetical protein [Bacteroidales bacterium]
MRLLRFIAAAIMCAGVMVAGHAQTASEVNATQKKMMAASAPCNQGPEAFKTFIEKFNTDADFLKERLKISDAQREKFADLLVPGNFSAKTPFAKDDDQWYQSWGEIQFAKVYLDCGWVDSYVEYTFEFIRDGGKWYLGKIVAGE